MVNGLHQTTLSFISVSQEHESEAIMGTDLPSPGLDFFPSFWAHLSGYGEGDP